MKTNQWIKVFLFTLLVLVAPIATYYVYFVEVREAFLLERFHAHLANIAARTENRFSSAFDVIRYNPGQKNDLGIDACRAPSTANGEPIAGGEPHGRRFVSRTATGTLVFHTEKCDTTVDVSTLVGSLDPDRQFYDLVIFDENDKVVFQRDPENGRVADGQLTTRASADSSDAKSSLKDPLVDMRRTYQGRPFLVFSQPIGVPIETRDREGPQHDSSAAARESSWKIVGLMGQTEFTRLKYSVGPGGLAVVVLIVLCVLVAAPFLKLRYLGRFERLSRYDIVLQAGAGLSLIAMATVAGLAWNTHVRLARYFDNRLESVAQDLANEIARETESAAKTLSDLERPMLESYERRERERRSSNDSNCPVLAERAREQTGPGIATAAGNILSTLKDITRDYRQLSTVYLMDQNGCQLVKWASAATVPEPGRFGDRRYFKRALPDERVPLRLNTKTTPNVFQDIVVSRTTGEREIVFSKPVTPPNACTDAMRADGKNATRVPCVSVITGRLRALDSVLPHGFGAMLLDADSGIEWRSDGNASTELNLAKEIDEPDRLRTLVRLAIANPSRLGQSFDADYQRKPHRFYVLPLEYGDLALVAFYDRNLVTEPVLEAAGAAGAAWLVWVSILIALFLALWIADDMLEGSLRRWPWCLSVVLPAVIAGAWFALTVSPTLLFAATGIALSLIPLLLLAGRDSSRISSQLRRVLIVLPTWFAATLAAAVPMKILYGQAELATLNALARFESVEYDRDSTAQSESFEQWKWSVALPDPRDWTDVAWWKNEEFLRLPSGAPTKAQHAECALFDVVCRLLENLPDYGAGLSGVHAMYRQAAAPIEEVRDELLADVPETYVMHIVVAGLALLLSIVAVWYLLVRAFGLRAENIVEFSSAVLPTGSEPDHRIVWGVPARERHGYLDRLQASDKLWVDLRDASPGSKIDIPSSVDAIAIDEFDAGLNDIAVVQQRVELVERLLREQRRVILLFVTTDPLNFVMAQYDTEQNAALLSRVATALSRFKLTYHQAEAKQPARSEWTFASAIVAAVRRLRGPPARADWRTQFVESECRHPDLWEIRDELLKEVEARKWSKAQIVQQVQSLANATFQHMWSKCTRVEKFTLIELALGHPVNPNNWDAAHRLRVRGYVLAAPFYRIASESLRQFVARMALLEDVQQWRAENPGTWDQVKVPLIILFLGVVAFFAVTQPALFNSVFAFLAAALATFPFIANALSARLQRATGSGGK